MLRLFPDYTEAHNNLGNLLVAQGRLDEAIEHVRAALATTPDHASAHNNLGTALVRQKKIKEAVESFAEEVRLRPEYTEARFNLATASMALGDTNAAQLQFEQLLTLSTNKSLTHTVIGAVLARVGRSGEAERHFKEAVELNSANVEATFNLGSL